MELWRHPAGLDVKDQGDIPCMVWRSAEIDTNPRSFVPLVLDSTARLQFLIQNEDWATEWLPMLRIGLHKALAELLQRGWLTGATLCLVVSVVRHSEAVDVAC